METGLPTHLEPGTVCPPFQRPKWQLSMRLWPKLGNQCKCCIYVGWQSFHCHVKSCLRCLESQRLNASNKRFLFLRTSWLKGLWFIFVKENLLLSICFSLLTSLPSPFLRGGSGVWQPEHCNLQGSCTESLFWLRLHWERRLGAPLCYPSLRHHHLPQLTHSQLYRKFTTLWLPA